MSGTQALLFRPGPTLRPDALRVARALLEDTARRQGGRLGALPDGGLRLEGAAAALDAARDALAAVLRGRDATVMEDRRATPRPAPAPRDVPEDRIAALPLRALIRLDPVLSFGPGCVPNRLALRALPDEEAITAALGPAWARAPYLEHARNLVGARLLREAAAWPGPLHLFAGESLLPALPPEHLPLRTPRALAEPPGCRYGVVGLHPAAPIGLAASGAHVLYLPGEPSPAALATLGRHRIILDGVADADALARAARAGVLGATGPAAARALAGRMA
ncbi:hypothetical protein ACE7GA_04800 [Roseomonas sp. CCTCC AB2023176]|uniref:hypothetical protein n=1 Tax=Roseomonas sp. CCTCC AB2023176 TaxID=3342640 RepID=UPI0035D9530C